MLTRFPSRGCILLLLTLFLLVSPDPLAAQEKLLPVLHFNRLTTADGLPTNEIRTNVVRDRQGFIWFGTENGLVRYDGYTCKVYRDFISPANAIELFFDSKDRFWVGTHASGLSLYDPAKDRFVHFLPRENDTTWLQARHVNSFYEDESANIWIGSDDPIPMVEQLDLGPAANETNADSVYRHARFRRIPYSGFGIFLSKVTRWDEKSLLASASKGLFLIDRSTGAVSRPGLRLPSGLTFDTIAVAALWWETPRRLWIGTMLQGLFSLDRSNESLTLYRKALSGQANQNSKRIQGIQPDNKGRLWIATGNGLDLFDTRSKRFQDFLPSAGVPGESWWTRLSFDNSGTLWIGTADDGLYFVPENSTRFPRYGLRGRTGRPMDMETINRWIDGTYWIGGEGGVYRIRINDRSVLEVVDLLKGEKSRSRTRGLWTSFDDGRGSLWFGTFGLGLYKFDPKSSRVTNFRFSEQLATWAMREDVCRSLLRTGGDSMLLAAYNDGLLLMDTGRKRFSRVQSIPSGGQPIHLMKDNSGKVWISDEFMGLFVLDPSNGKVEFFKHDPDDTTSISDLTALGTYQDPEGRIWIGCNDLNLWKPETRSFRRLPNPAFSGATGATPIGDDPQGRVWVRYMGKGVSVFDPKTNHFANFDQTDGTVDPFAMATLPDGKIVLTGIGGMNIVEPDSVFGRRPPPPFVIARVSINDSVSISQHTLATHNLELPYDENVLEFEFAAIEPGAAHLIEYRYRLEGLEDSWVNPASRRFVRYPGLAPGHYIFRARATSTFDRWPEQEIALAITITPPWWRTWWANGTYAVLFIGLLSAGYRVRVRQLSLRQRAEHLAEVDSLKSRFFANISHEFRTPLTLILGPIQKWEERLAPMGQKDAQAASKGPEAAAPGIRSDSDELWKDLSMVERNARRLLRLINQLLDLSKLEARAMMLRASRRNIVPIVRGLANSFESSARLRHIELDVQAGQEEIEVYCDRDMMEKIISNLVSNALKFTREGGSVRVSITLPPARPLTKLRERERGRGDKFVEISVSDTGVGIPHEQMEKIFDRFYQVDESQTREQEGSGIGLALVKELVELHHGTIGVKSEVGRGTEFTVRLPLGRDHLKDEEIVEEPTTFEPKTYDASPAFGERHAEEPNEGGESPATGDQRPIILLVEDNADVRTYIRSFLDNSYRVAEARDGAAGIEKALETIPDLVISDVMMPKKDGYEVCKTLKLDEKTSHIPVILLTAKAASENRIEGLEIGADDYLVKPFEPKELLARVKNLINLRRKLRERFKVGQVLKPGEITVSSIDDTFLQKVKAIVEIHMSEEGFGGEDLSREVGMSRSQIHRKLIALTGMPAGDFIRYLRLHRAMDLLRQNSATVAEIAYTVGFSTPAHFTKCFHEQFGKTPSEIRRTEQ